MRIKNYNLNKLSKYFFILSFIFIFIFIFVLVSVIIFSEDKWKLKIKGQEKEIPTNPIIKGTNVFLDIYDLSILFNIDYEINLTRKYIMFYKNINLPTSSTNINNTLSTSLNSPNTTNNNIKKTQDKSNVINKDTTNSLEIPNTSQFSYDNIYPNYSDKYSSNSLNKIILKEINSIKNIVIIDAINEIKPLYKDSIVYKEELNNVKDKLNDSFLKRLNFPVIVDKNQNINTLKVKEILEYLNKKDISAAIIPIIRAYEYHEKSENIMNPEVQVIIDYILINNKGDILYFDSQNVIRGLAVFSSSSTRYRKSKLLDLIDISVNNFINNFNRYKEIINKF